MVENVSFELEIKGRKLVPFLENASYSVAEVALILNRSEKVVRGHCRRGEIRCRPSRGGFLIGGWAVRAFIEGRREILNHD